MELKETIEMMQSDDYKERFKAEYLQLKIRMNGLGNMLKKYKEGTLTFKPSCSYDLLNGQFKAMDTYASYLEERAEIENIEL
ncbi:crAss001_48 related protein [Clostridium sulfidigenes]|uniref:crAss001_48 related protein n=1 Tax=Clostridium sulfidigenes TaxID=318464 RepID=UPI003F894DC6